MSIGRDRRLNEAAARSFAVQTPAFETFSLDEHGEIDLSLALPLFLDSVGTLQEERDCNDKYSLHVDERDLEDRVVA